MCMFVCARACARVCLCLFVLARACACVCLCLFVCARACVRVCACVYVFVSLICCFDDKSNRLMTSQID